METHPSESENPFAPPAEQASYAAQPVQAYSPSNHNMSRDGDKLVIRKRTQFPPVCVKTGQTVEVWLKRKFSWIHPLYYLMVLVLPVPALIVIAIISKRAEFQVPLSREIDDRRQKARLLGVLLALASFGAFILALVGGAMMDSGAVFLTLMLAFLVLFIVGIVFLNRANTMTIVPTRITNHFAWFRGVNPELLARLPEWERSIERDFDAGRRGQ